MLGIDRASFLAHRTLQPERDANRLRGHSADNRREGWKKLARPTRFERVTFAFGGQRSLISYSFHSTQPLTPCAPLVLPDWQFPRPSRARATGATKDLALPRGYEQPTLKFFAAVDAGGLLVGGRA